MQSVINTRINHFWGVPGILLSLLVGLSLTSVGCKPLSVTAPPEKVSVKDLGDPNLKPPTLSAPQAPVITATIVAGGGFVSGADTNTGQTLISGFVSIGEPTHAEVADSGTGLITSGYLTGADTSTGTPIQLMTLKTGFKGVLYSE